MKGQRFLPLLTLAILCLACARQQVAEFVPVKDETAFPANYTAWKKINKATIIQEGERVARDLYANELALKRNTDGTFPAGAILVKEERRLGPDPSGRLVPKEVFRVSVMFKVGRGEMDGWVFRAFDPVTRQEFPRDQVDPDGCYFCHSDARDRDYVFSDIQ